MIMCVLLCYPVSFHIYVAATLKQGILFLVIICTFYTVMLFPFTAILQLIDFTASYFLVY